MRIIRIQFVGSGLGRGFLGSGHQQHRQQTSQDQGQRGERGFAQTLIARELVGHDCQRVGVEGSQHQGGW